MKAMEVASRDTYGDRIATGIFYQNERPCYEESEKGTLDIPLCDHELGISPERAEALKANFRQMFQFLGISI